jgi:hypothetical protein
VFKVKFFLSIQFTINYNYLLLYVYYRVSHMRAIQLFVYFFLSKQSSSTFHLLKTERISMYKFLHYKIIRCDYETHFGPPLPKRRPIVTCRNFLYAFFMMIRDSKIILFTFCRKKLFQHSSSTYHAWVCATKADFKYFSFTARNILAEFSLQGSSSLSSSSFIFIRLLSQKRSLIE